MQKWYLICQLLFNKINHILPFSPDELEIVKKLITKNYDYQLKAWSKFNIDIVYYYTYEQRCEIDKMWTAYVETFL